MKRSLIRLRLISASLLTLGLASALSAQETLSDIDALMRDALEKQDVSWENNYNFFYREREELSFEGSFDAAPLHGSKREYFWHVRDGYMVRSPVSVDGVEVSEDERERAELKFIERLKKRQARENRRRERGVDRRSFFGLEFEPGNYFYAGRTTLDGRELLIIEHYPEDALGSDQEDDEETRVEVGADGVHVETVVKETETAERAEREKRDEVEAEDTEEDEIERQMNKVIFATMLVDPVEKQIVGMTLNNLGFDFLPARWLLQIDTVEATMKMHEPFTGIWLTESIDAHAKVNTAMGDLSVRFSKTFYDYAEGSATATYRFGPTSTKSKKRKKR